MTPFAFNYPTAVVELAVRDSDPAMGVQDVIWTKIYAKEVKSEPDGKEGWDLTWRTDDSQADPWRLPYEEIEEEDEGYKITSTEGQFVKVRELDPYDAVDMVKGLAVPQPLEAVESNVLRGGGVLAQRMDAAVAPDNTVITLVLETGLGTYLRYDNSWELLSPGSTALNSAHMVPVAGSALAVWDAADAANKSVSVFDLPRASQSPDGEQATVEPPPAPPVPEAASLTAAGVSIPVIASENDLPLGFRYAQMHPEARWYVAKRAIALGAGAQVPEGWLPYVWRPPVVVAEEEVQADPDAEVDESGIEEVVDLPPDQQVMNAASAYVASCQNGRKPSIDEFAWLLASARSLNMLEHPAVVEAARWQERVLT